jgi:hypothetical protein
MRASQPEMPSSQGMDNPATAINWYREKWMCVSLQSVDTDWMFPRISRSEGPVLTSACYMYIHVICAPGETAELRHRAFVTPCVRQHGR